MHPLLDRLPYLLGFLNSTLWLFVSIITTQSLVYGTFRTWTHVNGKTFVAECSGFTYPKVDLKSKAGRIYEIDIEDLQEVDMRFLWTVYSKDRVHNLLAEWEHRLESEGSKLRFAESDRTDVLTVLEYLHYTGQPIEALYAPKGTFKVSEDGWDRIHSGMLYYALDWLESMRDLFRDPRTDIKAYSVEKEWRQFRFIKELFESLQNHENYVSKRLGQQFPIKFKPEGTEDFRQPYHYYVYLPKFYDQKKQWPCIIWLPGEGQYGMDLRALLDVDLPKRLISDDEYPFIVISVGHGNTLMHVDYLNSIYADVKQRFKIDPDRVIGTGMSSGASATWRWACKQPELFAAIVPVAGIMPHFEMRGLTQVPIWLFNNEADNVWIQNLAIQFFESRNEAFKYTLYKDAKGHDAWSLAYNDKRLVEWMLKQKRTGLPHPINPIEKLKIENQLSKAVIKDLPSYDILALELAPIDRLREDSVKNAYYFKKGLSETYDTTRALDTLLTFFQDKPNAITGPLIQVIAPNSENLYFGFPVQNIHRSTINRPYEREHLRPMQAYCAYYYGKKLNTSVAINVLRARAIKAGHSLSGSDRIVYHQLMTPQQYVFEIQLGIKLNEE